MKNKLQVLDQQIAILNQDNIEYINITDIARYKNPDRTDAIKANLIPEELTPAQISHIYADEADLLNVALFGITARQWREANPELGGNMRDHANVHQLVCLANLENTNAYLIQQGVGQVERIQQLNALAIKQMTILTRQGVSGLPTP